MPGNNSLNNAAGIPIFKYETIYDIRSKLINTILICVSFHDLIGKHLMVDNQTCALHGYTREELLNMTVMDAAGPEFRYKEAIQLWHDMKPGTSFTFNIKTKKKDGSLYVSGTGLGLTVVWNIVQDHWGYIDVISDRSGILIN